MRKLTFWSVLLLACMAATPVVASDLSVLQHNAQGSLIWRGAGSMLDLESQGVGGVVVTRAGTGGTWGLRQGDVILAVDGHPVRQVAALVDRLRASKPRAVHVRVRRGPAQQELTLAASDYGHLVGPRPPVPATPPVSPSAPLPPPPTPPPGG
ncbi:MAG: PDZ domain-containing protein [Rhodanobacter sp.]